MIVLGFGFMQVNCQWSHFYTMRAKEKNGPLTLLCAVHLLQLPRVVCFLNRTKHLTCESGGLDTQTSSTIPFRGLRGLPQSRTQAFTLHNPSYSPRSKCSDQNGTYFFIVWAGHLSWKSKGCEGCEFLASFATNLDHQL